MVDAWKSGAVKSTLKDGSQTIQADAAAVESIEAAVNVLKDNLESRQTHQLLIADLLDIDPAELQSGVNDESNVPAQLAVPSAPPVPEDPEPDVPLQGSCILQDVFLGEMVHSLHELLVKLRPYAVDHRQRGSYLGSRPKLVFGLAREDGALPLYVWNQEVRDRGLIAPCPDFLMPFLAVVQQKFGEEYNHIMVTYHDSGMLGYIPPHSDKRFSHETDDRCISECRSTLVDLSLGETRTFYILKKSAGNLKGVQAVTETCLLPHMVARFSMTSGSVVVIRGPDNQNFLHAVPLEPDVFGLRISVLFRAVNANGVDVSGQRMMIGNFGWIDVPQPFRPQPDVSHMFERARKKRRHLSLSPLQRARLKHHIQQAEIQRLECLVEGGTVRCVRSD